MIAKTNKYLSFINLIFLLAIPIVVLLRHLGILAFSLQETGLILAITAFCSIFPFVFQRASYNEQAVMHTILFCMNVLMWLFYYFADIRFSFIFILVPFMALRYCSVSIVFQYSILNFFVMLGLLLYKFQSMYGALFWDEHFEEFYWMLIYNGTPFLAAILVINIQARFVEHLEKERAGMEEELTKRLEEEKEKQKEEYKIVEREEVYDTQSFFYGLSRDMDGLVRGKNKRFEMQVDQALPVALIGLKNELREALGGICSDLLLFHEEAYVKMNVTFLAGITPKRGQKITLQIEIRSNTDIAAAAARHQALNFFLTQKIIDRMKGSFENQSDSEEAVFVINVLQTVENEMSIEKRTNRDLTRLQTARNSQSGPLDFSLYKKIKVLVVDDNPESLKLIDAILHSVSVEADCVKNGLIGMKLLESREYQMVFLDQMMPEKSGSEIVKEIRYMKDDYYQELPVILMSLNTTKDAREEYEALGFSDVIPKPIRVADIKRILQKWIKEAYPLTYLEYRKVLEAGAEDVS